MTPVNLGPNDTVSVNDTGTAIKFSFENDGNLAGFDFSSTCATYFNVQLIVGRAQVLVMPGFHIRLGDHEKNPPTGMFTVFRRRA